MIQVKSDSVSVEQAAELMESQEVTTTCHAGMSVSQVTIGNDTVMLIQGLGEQFLRIVVSAL